VKLLIHSNGPDAKTGYGVQTRLLVDRLVDDGHEVAISATYGQQQACGVGTYVTRSGQRVQVFPSYMLVSGEDVVYAHAKQFFGSDEGWIIPLLDMWSMSGKEMADFNAAAWTPVDHDPVPPIVTRFFDRAPTVRCIAMSRHGQQSLQAHGVDAAYIPLAVDTNVYSPTPTAVIDGQTVTGRQFLQLPDTAFVVGMVGMNKDPNDRKGFQEAFMAFAEFAHDHPEAILHVHSDKTGVAGGLDLPVVARACGIPETQLSFTNQYAYLIGLPPKLMALIYTAFDVLLAPSAGEGFCVPLVEAQACGTPVIASDFTAQSELVAPGGWLVGGQRWWDQPSHSWYVRPAVGEIIEALEAARDEHEIGFLTASPQREFARRWDADYVYDTYWRPYLLTLDERPPADKPKMERVAVVVPAMKRPHNVKRLVESFYRSGQPSDMASTLYYVLDENDTEMIEAVRAMGLKWLPATRGTSFASKVNAAFEQTDEDWLFITGDDVEFTPGWLEAARELSDRYDVIGTNDSEPGRIRNPRVATGVHSDHFFMRRSYATDEGGSLEGPGLPLPEAYFHWYTDMEVIQLAKARGVFTPCLESRVIHHHPGYAGDEAARQADPVYMKAVEFSEMDRIAFKRRAVLIDMHKVVRRDIWKDVAA